jgi:hypothetical protein
MECPICFERYNLSTNIARKLACSHTLCHDCINKTKRDGIVSCTLCFKKTQNPDSLPDCQTIQHIIFSLEHPKNKVEPPPPVREMKILIRNLYNKSFEITVALDQSILKLKEQIKEIEGVEIAHQWLLFQGKSLKDEELVKDCNLYPGAVVSLVRRLLGG